MVCRRAGGEEHGDWGDATRRQWDEQTREDGVWAGGSCDDGRPPQGVKPGKTVRLREVNNAGWLVWRADAEEQSSWGVWGRPRTPF